MGKYVAFLNWAQDAPHLSDVAKAELLEGIPENERRARTEGVPYLGAGAIWHTPLNEVLIDPFKIPDHYYRCFGFDVGWQKSAALWYAEDRDQDVGYLYSEHYLGEEQDFIHASAIKGTPEGRERGHWIPGFIDPAANGRSQKDGERLFRTYRDGHKMNIEMASNALYSGINDINTRLSLGKLKVFRTLKFFAFEYNIYHRDKDGKVVKKHDHLMSCLRYIINSGISEAKTYEPSTVHSGLQPNQLMQTAQGWMSA